MPTVITVSLASQTLFPMLVGVGPPPPAALPTTHTNTGKKVWLTRPYVTVWLAIRLISNGNNEQGAGCSTWSSHLATAIHSPRKVWYCLVEPFNTLECRTSIAQSELKAWNHRLCTFLLYSFANQTVNDSGRNYLIQHKNSYIMGFAESIYTVAWENIVVLVAMAATLVVKPPRNDHWKQQKQGID